MSRAVLISIRPQWCELIASGKKTIEVRKTRPKLETPFKCYIYCTSVKNMSPQEYLDMHKKTNGFINKWNAKVIGEFVCDGIIVDKTLGHDEMFYTAACLSPAEVAAYCINDEMYGWHISKLVIYAKPKALSEFRGRKLAWRGNNHIHVYEELTRPPQSWCYVEEFK